MTDWKIFADVVATPDFDTHVGVGFQRCRGGEFSDQSFTMACGDRLVAEADGERKVLVPSDTYHYEYETELEASAEDTEFRISFERPNGNDPPDAVGRLPAPFEITSPMPEEVGSGSEMRVTWSPSGTDDEMYLAVADADPLRPCLYPYYHSNAIPDDGEHVVPSGSVELSHPETERCDSVLTLDRFRDAGRVCDGIDLTLIQRRSFQFTLTR